MRASAPIAQGVGVDRKTARRYIAAAVELGVDRSGGEEQLTDELIGQVVERVRPHRPDGHGEAWRTLLAEEAADQGVGEAGPDRRQDRDPARPHGASWSRPAPWPASPSSVAGPAGGPSRSGSTTRRRGSSSRSTSAASGSSPTASGDGCAKGSSSPPCFSRHQFVWPTFSQTTEEVIRGFEAAWGYFGGVFPVVIPDNMKSIVIEAENTAPRFNDVFMEYAQSRGFVIDAARVATPTDKPRVERVVHYVQKNFFAGETFVDLADCRARAETWCTHDGRHAHPRHDPVPAHRGVPHRGAAAAARPALRTVRHAEVVRPQGPP